MLGVLCVPWELADVELMGLHAARRGEAHGHPAAVIAQGCGFVLGGCHGAGWLQEVV